MLLGTSFLKSSFGTRYNSRYRGAVELKRALSDVANFICSPVLWNFLPFNIVSVSSYVIQIALLFFQVVKIIAI